MNINDYQPADLIGFFDAESTDLPKFKDRSNDPGQPHLVDVAVLVYTTAGEHVHTYQAYVRPEGWTSTPEAFAAHGLTDEYLELNGIAEATVTSELMLVLNKVGLRVAHNRNCDDRFVRAAIARYLTEDVGEAFKAGAGECTALLSKSVCKLPPTEAMKKTNFKNSYKTPTLGEAFTHLTGGKVLQGAHSALADAQACARVYFLLKGVRMPEFPDDAQALREELPRLPHGQEECEAAQLPITETVQ